MGKSKPGAPLGGKSAAIPKKSLGQHFLHNPEVSRRIVALLDAAREDNILEIGPGRGALTAFLVKEPHQRLLLLEKDSLLAKSKIYGALPSLQVLNMDALKFPWPRLAELGAWKIVGNLPYNVASPLIWDITSKCGKLKRAVFMAQKEVGLRLAASPGSRDYGALSVWTQSFMLPKLEFILPPGAFTPPPKVESAVVSFTPVASQPKYPVELALLLRVCFQQRRKQLGGIFKRAGLGFLNDKLGAMGLNESLRPENLGNAEFQELAAAYAVHSGAKDS